MRFRRGDGYILVISPFLVKWFGKMTTGTFKAKGAALFPFLFVRDEALVFPGLVNHERIHFRQQLEMLLIGTSVLTFFEKLYARFFLKLTKEERYLYVATEQEAYLNMHDEGYLQHRPFWNIFHYVFTKRRFRLVGPGQLEFLD